MSLSSPVSEARPKKPLTVQELLSKEIIDKNIFIYHVKDHLQSLTSQINSESEYIDYVEFYNGVKELMINRGWTK
mgnify:CR=1 FL=1